MLEYRSTPGLLPSTCSAGASWVPIPACLADAQLHVCTEHYPLVVRSSSASFGQLPSVQAARTSGSLARLALALYISRISMHSILPLPLRLRSAGPPARRSRRKEKASFLASSNARSKPDQEQG